MQLTIERQGKRSQGLCVRGTKGEQSEMQAATRVDLEGAPGAIGIGKGRRSTGDGADRTGEMAGERPPLRCQQNVVEQKDVWQNLLIPHGKGLVRPLSHWC